MSQSHDLPQQIEAKERIPESVRTTGKDEAADYIINEVLERGRWPMPLTEIADESGWSRQHIRNTLTDYFQEATGEKTNGPELTPANDGRSITVPESVENLGDFLAGVEAGYRLARDD